MDINCTICTHRRRRELDSEIIRYLEQDKDEGEVLRLLAEFCAEKEIELVLSESILAEHLKRHTLVGVIGVPGGGIIRLPSGERIDTNDTKSVLRTLLAYGLANVMENPQEITLPRLIRIAELLLRPDPNEKDGEMEELKALILGRMQEKPPLQLDTVKNPYAAPSNVGKLREG